VSRAGSTLQPKPGDMSTLRDIKLGFSEEHNAEILDLFPPNRGTPEKQMSVVYNAARRSIFYHWPRAGTRSATETLVRFLTNPASPEWHHRPEFNFLQYGPTTVSTTRALIDKFNANNAFARLSELKSTKYALPCTGLSFEMDLTAAMITKCGHLSAIRDANETAESFMHALRIYSCQPQIHRQLPYRYTSPPSPQKTRPSLDAVQRLVDLPNPSRGRGPGGVVWGTVHNPAPRMQSESPNAVDSSRRPPNTVRPLELHRFTIRPQSISVQAHAPAPFPIPDDPSALFNTLPEASEPQLAQGDDDVSFVAESRRTTCSIGFVPITQPVKGRFCTHWECFELTCLLQFAKQRRNWECPKCKGSCNPDGDLLACSYFFNQSTHDPKAAQDVCIVLD